MQYLGALRGEGTLVGNDGQSFGHVDYDIDGFVSHTKEVVGSGELQMPPEALDLAFGRTDLVLQTEGGLSLALRFSGKRLANGSGAAHVDITAGLPPRQNWRRR